MNMTQYRLTSHISLDSDIFKFRSMTCSGNIIELNINDVDSGKIKVLKLTNISDKRFTEHKSVLFSPRLANSLENPTLIDRLYGYILLPINPKKFKFYDDFGATLYCRIESVKS